MSMHFTLCAMCSAPVERVMHHFSSRRPPFNRPFQAALYFRATADGMPLEEYCGAICSTASHTRDKRA